MLVGGFALSTPKGFAQTLIFKQFPLEKIAGFLSNFPIYIFLTLKGQCHETYTQVKPIVVDFSVPLLQKYHFLEFIQRKSEEMHDTLSFKRTLHLLHICLSRKHSYHVRLQPISADMSLEKDVFLQTGYLFCSTYV
jgi:hypothetical protein